MSSSDVVFLHSVCEGSMTHGPISGLAKFNILVNVTSSGLRPLHCEGSFPSLEAVNKSME